MNLGRIPGRRLAGSLSVSILPLATLVLCSCTAVEGPGSPLYTSTLVRVIDASYNSPALDAYVASTPIATNFAGPSISNYAFLPPGTATIEVTPTGKSTVLAQINGTLDGGQEHSVYITGQGTNFQMSLLSDQNAPAPSGSVAIRFLAAGHLNGRSRYLFCSGRDQDYDGEAGSHERCSRYDHRVSEHSCRHIRSGRRSRRHYDECLHQCGDRVQLGAGDDCAYRGFPANHYAVGQCTCRQRSGLIWAKHSMIPATRGNATAPRI